MKDRLSLHIDNGQSGIREAVTILRNGGQASQSGLVGITNAVYFTGEDPIIPATIFNVQSTGDSNIRFSSGPSSFYRSSLELLGNGNGRASGLHICYDPEFDNSYVIDDGYGIGQDVGASDKTVVDFSLIRPSGCQGIEFSHISMSERGFVSVGLTRVGNERLVEANAPLTVAYVSNNVSDSGTISILQQSEQPVDSSGFGKIYVKPFNVGGRSQAIFFKDDAGNETNLVLSQDIDANDSTDGLIFGHNGNTYGGWYCPELRSQDSTKANNTYYGWETGFNLSSEGAVSGNTLFGYRAGKGLFPTSSFNTVFGHNSLVGFRSCDHNIILGHNNVNGGNDVFGGIDNSIIIGHSLYTSSIPDDYTLAIGINNPIIVGKLNSNKNISVVDATFSVLNTSNAEFKVSSSFDSTNNRYSTFMDLVDLTVAGVNRGKGSLEIRSLNSTGLTQSLLLVDSRGAAMSNTPTYEQPAETTPFARLDADLQLRGAIRFQDGSSLSGVSNFNLLPLNATSGVGLQTISGENYFTLNYTELQLAGNVASEIRTDNTFVAVQLDGTNSSKVGKMSLQGLAAYISSGVDTITENCNVLISNAENEVNVNTASMSSSVFIGCNVAAGASGWKHSVMIGSEAGKDATVSNPDLDMDKSCIFIGYRAGYDSDNLENSIAIGTNAGNNSDTASDSIFIGSNAGLNSNFSNSIGLGEHALRGQFSGTGNLEIVCGIDDNNRLMHNIGDLSNRINIMNVIAGRRDICNISIGKPRLSPLAPLEVRRDSVIHATNPNDYIQSWHCDDEVVASIDCDGTFRSGSASHSQLNVSNSGTIQFINVGSGIYFPDGTFQNSAPSPASATFPSDLTVSLDTGKTFGRYINGDVIPASGKTSIEVIQMAVVEPRNPTVSLSTSVSNIETGTVNVSVNLTFSYTINNPGASVSSVVLEFRRGNTGSWTTLMSNPASNSFTHSFVNDSASDINYRYTVVDSESSQASSSRNVNFSYKVFYGASASVPTTSANVRSLPESIFTESEDVFNLNTGSSHVNFTVAIPTGETLSEVIDLDALNANITSEYVNNPFAVDDAGGNPVQYNVYTMTTSIPYSSNHRHRITKV
jgi:hypothetical protein